jgi:transcriptional regulator with XRE-family HTH domain
MAASDGLYKQIGRRIREAREHARPKLSQERLAKRLGISRASIVNIEAGRQHAPVHVLWQIAELLGTDLTLLIPRRDEVLSLTAPIQLDKTIINKIKLAANGDTLTQKNLTGFISKFKTTLQSSAQKKRQ